MYLKPEILEKDNQYDCSKCKCKVDAGKGHRFLKLPKVLCLNLNRFTFCHQTGNRLKLSNFLSFPLYLNMNEFMK